MAYDDQLSAGVRDSFMRRQVSFDEKRMMGGLCFLVNGKMCVGVDRNRLMARIDPAVYDEALMRAGCRPMDFTGRPMRGFVFIERAGFATDQALDGWLDLALEFNLRAMSFKKKPRAKSASAGSGGD